MRRALVAVALLAAIGCDKRSFVKVTVLNIPGATERLDATVENNSETKGPYPIPLTGALLGASTLDFSISFPEGRSGSAKVKIDAVKGGGVVASKSGEATIVPHEVSPLTIELPGPMGPMDLSGVADLSMGPPDLAVAADLSPTGDIAVVPDLGPVFDNTGLQGWYRADVGVTTVMNTQSVFEWADSSGKGHTAQQPTAMNQPIVVPNTLNGHPVIRFDGNQRWLGFDASYLPNSNYTIVVVEARAKADSGWIVAGGQVKLNGGFILTYPNPTTFRFSQYQNDFDRTVPQFMNPKFEITSCAFDAAVGHTVYRVGLAPFTTAEKSPIVGPIAMNGSTIGGTILVWFTGDLAELMFFDRAIGDPQRAAIEAYLKAKYNL